MQNQFLRAAVRSLYDIQKMRIQSGNRIVAAFRTKLGIAPSESEKDDDDAAKLLESLRTEYKRMTNGVVKVTKKFECDSPLITNTSELYLLQAYDHQCKTEDIHTKAIKNLLEAEPIWNEWLGQVRGIGPLMGGVLLSEIDIHKAQYPSSLWKLAGLDVAPNAEGVMEGRSKRSYHLVPKTYTNRDGEITETVGITFNPFLKTKMVGVLADVFIKVKGKYRNIYDDYKNRLENHEVWKDRTKAHRHNAAKRYMVKRFLADLHAEWRRIEGLPVALEYHEAKLGHKHGQK